MFLERIKTCKTISRTNFDHFIKKYGLTKQENERCAQSLTKYGYTVVRGDNSYITPNHLAKINRKYGVEEALKRTEGLPVMSPIIHLPSDTPVRKNENGDYEVSEKTGSGNYRKRGGGIVGYFSGQNLKMVLDGCENYGHIKSLSNSRDAPFVISSALSHGKITSPFPEFIFLPDITAVCFSLHINEYVTVLL